MPSVFLPLDDDDEDAAAEVEGDLGPDADGCVDDPVQG
jgi:hypothetical protein